MKMSNFVFPLELVMCQVSRLHEPFVKERGSLTAGGRNELVP